MDILEAINNYSAFFSLLSSLLMLIITTIYVYFTKEQANSASESFTESIKQFRESKQPCLIPVVKKVFGEAFDTSTYLRIQFYFQYEIENIGDSPALAVNTIAKMRLVNSSKEVEAHLMPDYRHFVSVMSKVESEFHFETSEFRNILEDLQISSVKNRKRIETNPSQSAYRGPSLVISIYYKNMIGQWFETTIEQELLSIKKLVTVKGKIMEGGDDVVYTSDEEIKGQDIADGDRIKGYMINPAFSHLTHNKISEHEVMNILNKYDSRNS